jgi:cation:H+ antiporter
VTAEVIPPAETRLLWQLRHIAMGLFLLVLGARWLVWAAVTMAHRWGVSDVLIGLTIIAAGTSLPELATSLVATWRGQRDIAIGNVVGSNIFNILGILGLASVLSPAGLTVDSSMRTIDLTFMTLVALLCLPSFFTGFRISRLEGAVYLGLYLAYMAHLVLDAMNHPAHQMVVQILLVAGIPVVLAALLLDAILDFKPVGQPATPRA